MCIELVLGRQSYGNYSSIVWSTHPAHAARLASLTPAQLLEELNFALRAVPADLAPGYSTMYVTLPSLALSL